MANAAFEFFEEICNELRDHDETVLVEDDFSPSVVSDLKRRYKEPVAIAAIRAALAELEKHFQARGAALPFEYDLQTCRYQAVDRDYIAYISDANGMRGRGVDSKEFERATSKRLIHRLTGLIRRVGSPRDSYKKKNKFNTYLRQFGFRKDVLPRRTKGVGDGGFDILWLPPLGAVPLRPVVSMACKNSRFNRDQGFSSVGKAKQSHGCHSHMSASETYMCCVIYNDYIDQTYLPRLARVEFVPLGLSDLSTLENKVDHEQL